MKTLPLIALTASLLASGAAFAAEQTVTLNVANATCELCGPIVKRALSNVPGVLDVDVSEATGAAIAKVRFDDSQTNVAALITAIVLARMATARRVAAAGVSPDGTMVLGGGRPAAAPGQPGEPGLLKTILLDTVRSPAISALFLGLAIGLLSKPESVYQSFYEPLFRGLLSILMLIMGMEAWARLSELRKVAHAYLVYGLSAPIIHGLVGFGAGLIAHHLTGFSPGGVILLSVIAASSSDISGPPTLRGALPEANPSAYVGTSTGIGTPIAILSIPLWVALADLTIGLG